jgi:ABC-type glycerol-3-phosphate transport system substrate-binding protein
VPVRTWIIARAALVTGCLAVTAGCAPERAPVLTFSGSALGREGEVLAAQIARFRTAHPELRVEIRPTPDAADERHQLYVQWLNARSSDPDVLQLDVVWAAEFAAAGWVQDLESRSPDTDDFFAAAIDAGRWNRRLYALPWFVDVGMLYRRSDLVPEAPHDLAEVARVARGRPSDVPFGLVWQGARYEGLITVFLEYLGAFGGAMLDEHGQVVVDSPPAVRALSYMRDSIHVDGVVPASVLTWQEEQSRFAFQNGQAVFMRNWPYAYPLLEDAALSRVAGRVAVSAMPAGDGGAATAALGGSLLAINAHSDQAADAARLIAFLLAPEQMIERAEWTGQFPPRRSLYADPRLAAALSIPAADALAVIDRATARPATPVYSQLSDILQVAVHRALTRQQDPPAALHDAATEMRAALTRAHLAPAQP